MRRRALILSLCLVSLLVAPVWAEDFACFDAARPLGTQFRYLASMEPSQVTSPLCGPPIPDAQIAAQRALVAQVPTHAGHQCVQMSCYLKVEGGLAVEMTQAEKDAVDGLLQQQADARAIAQNEIATNEVCANNTLTEITAYWKGPGGKQAQLQATIATLDTAIAAVTAGPAKTAIQAARDALATHMTMFINDSELAWRYLCSRTFVRP